MSITHWRQPEPVEGGPALASRFDELSVTLFDPPVLASRFDKFSVTLFDPPASA